MIDSSSHSPKLFVLDTNVILHDAGCLRNFEENDVAIPITVLEELDQFKKGNGDINLQAREFLRELDSLTGDVLSPEGASLGEGLGAVRVVLSPQLDKRLHGGLLHDSPDHRILNSALWLQRQVPTAQVPTAQVTTAQVTTGQAPTEQAPTTPVVLVTKDTNLRMKAKAFGLRAQDYTSDKVESFDKLYTGKRVVENVAGDCISAFYRNGGTAPAADVVEVEQPLANENFILRNGSRSVLATYRAQEQTLVRVDKTTTYGISPRNAEQSFAMKALTNNDIKLVTLAGKAGTGKTLLALASALECRADYRQILLARPVVPLSNRDLGYLPGDIAAKLDPYMQPLYDNLTVIRHQFDENDPAAQRIQKMLELEKLVISPLAYIRGRSLQRIFFIVDEAQNLTPHEVKTIITRAGAGTKIVFTGDIHQIDHPYLDSLSNGLSYLISRMVGQPLYAHITLEKGERSQLADVASDLL